jgi:septal ring factor EnvC (AmiA/AmiB activator)
LTNIFFYNIFIAFFHLTQCPSESSRAESERLQTLTRELDEELRRCRANLENQVTLMMTEQRAWASERAQLEVQLRNAQHEALTCKTLLSTERASWIMERQRLNDTSRSASPHSEICDQQLESKVCTTCAILMFV